MRDGKTTGKRLPKKCGLMSQGKLFSEIGARHSGFERAVIFLLNKVLIRPLQAFILNIFRGENAGIFDCEDFTEPSGVVLCHLPQVITVVMSPGCKIEKSPSPIFSENRLKEVPTSRILEGIFRKQTANRVCPHDAVNVIASDNLYDRPISESNEHLRFVGVSVSDLRWNVAKKTRPYRQGTYCSRASC